MRVSTECCGLKGGTPEKAKTLEAAIPQREVARLYDRIAPVYDLWARLTETKDAVPRGGHSRLQVKSQKHFAEAKNLRNAIATGGIIIPGQY